MSIAQLSDGLQANVQATSADSVVVARGNLYLSHEVYENYMAGIEAVALIEREGQVMVVPLTPQSGGGLLLKIRTLRGDRVIHAQEFFREKGFLENFQERRFSAHWNANAAALVVSGIPMLPT